MTSRQGYRRTDIAYPRQWDASGNLMLCPSTLPLNDSLPSPAFPAVLQHNDTEVTECSVRIPATPQQHEELTHAAYLTISTYPCVLKLSQHRLCLRHCLLHLRTQS